MAERDRLNEDVTCRRRFHGAGDYGNLEGLRRKLVEQLIATAAAHHVQPLAAVSDQLLDLEQGASIKQSQAFQDATDCRGG